MGPSDDQSLRIMSADSATIFAESFGSMPRISMSVETLPGPKQRSRRPLHRWSSMASLLATWSGWCCWRHTGAGPMWMLFVCGIAAAMNSSGMVMFSYAIVWCSPIQNSSKPNSSARMTSSMSSS